jgi:pimeloyl-ACP methyl ester carboxylesterase
VSTVSKILGAAGIATGVIGAAALGGVTAQRMVVRRYQAAQSALLADPQEAQGYGSLAADRTYSVDAEDGVALHVEEVGPVTAPLTVIFSHGWTLRSGAWHYQRLGLAGPGFGEAAGGTGEADVRAATAADSAVEAAGGADEKAAAELARLVFFDQRSHGASTRAPEGHSTMDYLASDLAQMIATAAPVGPLVLVGHSMGGMAMLTLAARKPELFAERVAGLGLVCTGATSMRPNELTRLLMTGGNPLVRAVTSLAARYPAVFERGRESSRDAVWLLTRSLGFARADVPGAMVDYLDEMISGTPVEVIAEFTPALLAHDQSAALPALSGIPTVIVAGDKDRMTPLARSQAIADALPDAEFVVARGSGHMAMMEDPTVTNDALRQMLRRALVHAATLPPTVHRTPQPGLHRNPPRGAKAGR